MPPHTAVNKVVGPPVINKPAGPAVATGPAVAMGPTTVVEKPTVPTALAGKPLQTAAADRVPAKIQRSNTISAFDRNSKKALLLRWCQRMTQDYDVSLGWSLKVLNILPGHWNDLNTCRSFVSNRTLT